MRHKSDAAEVVEQFLADTRTDCEQFLGDTHADDIPSKVVIVGSDGGGEFRGAKVGDPCRSR